MAENIATVNAEGALVDNPKLEQVFLSIEKQLIAQTGFLKSMQSLQNNQFKFTMDMAKKTQSEKSRELVSQEDGSNLRDTKAAAGSVPMGKSDDLSNGIGGLLAKVLGALGGLSIAGLAAALLRKSLPALLAPAIGAFIGGAVEQTLKELGMSDKASAGIGEAATSGATWAIWGKLLFGNKGAIVGLLAGIGSKLGTVMESNKDNIVGSIMRGFNSDPKFWDEWGTEIGGAASILLMLFGKRLGILIKTIAAAAFAAALAGLQGGKTPSGAPGAGIPGTPGSATGGPATTAPGPGAPNKGTVPSYKPGQFSVPGGITTQGSVSQLPLPSGTKVKSNGKVGPQSIDDIVNDLKSRGKNATLAKYAKFFKFAGPAMAVIPALITPAMSILNDSPEQQIKKEIAIALGSISGAYLGAIAGAAGSTVIPIVGQSGIGNLLFGALGGIGGALSGEFLAEKLADALMGGPPPEPVSTDYDPANPESLPFITSTPASATAAPVANRAAGRATMLNDPRLVTAPQITPADSMGNRAEAMAGMQSATASSTGAGVNVSNNMGGNVSNNTNVGDSSTTYNIFQSSGSQALSNSLPVPMAG